MHPGCGNTGSDAVSCIRGNFREYLREVLTMYRIGIDLGGTNIKAVLLDEFNHIVVSDSCPTQAASGFEGIMNSILILIRKLFSEVPEVPGTERDEIRGGLTIPGQIYGPEGPVLYAPNLGWHDVDPVAYLRRNLGVPFVMANDADCIALAEAVVGTGEKYRSILMLALGTGVGGAFILNRQIFDGFGAFGGEFGHFPLVHNGHPCSCGLNGCFEQYCSATALARLGREAMAADSEAARNSSLWALCAHEPERLTTVHLFKAAAEGDPAAVKAINDFLDYLAEGITGLVNIFRPEAVIIGGGLAEAGDALFIPVNERISKMTYGHSYISAPPVIKASGGVYTGAIGAALLTPAEREN